MFAAFPEFTQLSVAHREAYNLRVAQYPPVSDILFATLMIWWNFAQDMCIAELNGNLVISYHLPTDEQNSGLGLIGTQRTAESVEAIFAWQCQMGQIPRLVHVPDFTVRTLQTQAQFNLVEERNYNEYIVPVKSLFPLEAANHDFRRKIKKFLSEAGENNVVLVCLDLSDSANQQHLMNSAEDWWSEFGSANDQLRSERQALRISIGQAKALDIRDLCLYVNGKLEGFVLYQLTQDGNYIILNHIKVRYAIPRIFDFLTYAMARLAVESGVTYLNLEMDLGVPGLRTHKSEFRALEFFRKYTITPVYESSRLLSRKPLNSSMMGGRNAYANTYIPAGNYGRISHRDFRGHEE